MNDNNVSDKNFYECVLKSSSPKFMSYNIGIFKMIYYHILGTSPILNPIENVCYIMKNNVEKQIPRNVDELKRFMVEEFLRKQSKILICL